MLNQKINGLLSLLNPWPNAQKIEEAKNKVGPSFIGSKKEFKRYVGPLMRNLIQQTTRKHRIAVGRCEHCNSTEKLEAAHKNGKERNSIIYQLLNDYAVGDQYHVDLKEFEFKFLQEHKELENTILILCKPCHRKYDSKQPKVSTRLEEPEQVQKKRKEAFSAASIVNAKKDNGQERVPIYTASNFSEFKNMKIGQVVRSTLPQLLKKDKLSTTEITKLQDSQYSKLTFDVNYPVLIKVDPRKSILENRTDNGYTRYYAKPVKNNGENYLITSEWYDRNREEYIKWLRRKIGSHE